MAPEVEKSTVIVGQAQLLQTLGHVALDSRQPAAEWFSPACWRHGIEEGLECSVVALVHMTAGWLARGGICPAAQGCS